LALRVQAHQHLVVVDRVEPAESIVCHLG
jgi:hypothetical protein